MVSGFQIHLFLPVAIEWPSSSVSGTHSRSKVRRNRESERCSQGRSRTSCRHRKCISVAEPKSHGLIFLAPTEERENGLPKWWWELWRFLLALEFKQLREQIPRVLLLAGRAID